MEGPTGSRDAETRALHFTFCLPCQPHPLCPESLGIFNATRPRGHNTLEVRALAEALGSHKDTTRVSDGLFTPPWAGLSLLRGLLESERPGGRG